jgi:hypothetical protein
MNRLKERSPKRRHRIAAISTIMPVLTTGLLVLPDVSDVIAEAQTAAECLSRPAAQISTPTGTRLSSYQVDTQPDDHTYDLRGLTVARTDPYGDLSGIVVGHDSSAQNPCVIGGTVTSSLSRGTSWSDAKNNYDGSGLEINGTGDITVDGTRVDNIQDGLVPIEEPRDSGVLTARNLYMRYIRDDCI